MQAIAVESMSRATVYKTSKPTIVKTDITV